MYKISGIPKSTVIGTDTSIDSLRLKTLTDELLNVHHRSGQAYFMGEHGDYQMVPWSYVYIGGEPFYKVIANNKDRVGNIGLDKLVFDTANDGWEVFNRKGTTYYSIAATTLGIMK